MFLAETLGMVEAGARVCPALGAYRPRSPVGGVRKAMKLNRKIHIAALVLVASAALTACGPDASSDAAAVVSEAPVEASTEPMAEEATPEPAPAPPVVVVGDTVAPAEVDLVRQAGSSVYVSPRGDGTGLVVDPAATIPQVVYDDLWITSQAAPSDEEIAATPADQSILDDDLVRAVRDAVLAANFQLFLVYPSLSMNDPANDYVTYRSGYIASLVMPTPAETRAMADELQKSVMEGVPVGQARLDHYDAITQSPESYIEASRSFLEAHPAQIVILK